MSNAKQKNAQLCIQIFAGRSTFIYRNHECYRGGLEILLPFGLPFIFCLAFELSTDESV